MSTLNERIAKVKGWYCLGKDWCPPGVDVQRTAGIWSLTDWQHSISDAWELVEEMEAEGLYVCIEGPVIEKDDWRCSVSPKTDGGIGGSALENAGTACEAICKAWLEVHGK